MSPHELLDHCLSRPGARWDNPWDHDYPVAKLAEPGRIFCFLGAHTCGVNE